MANRTVFKNRVAMCLSGLVAVFMVFGAASCGSDSTPKEVECEEGFLNCDGVCVDPLNNVYHCGECGETCDEGEVCNEGDCEVFCSSGREVCSGVCVDTQRDRFNCGECGNVCGLGEVCSAGTCSLSCQETLTNCDGICVNIQSDEDNCGSCGRSCDPGEVCSEGDCTYECMGETIECGGKCIDPLTSNQYCGASGDCDGGNVGEMCLSWQTCDDGVCEDLNVLKVLLLSNSDAGNNWIKENFSLNIPMIDIDSMDVLTSVPSLDSLLDYDVVLLFESGVFDNSTNVGELLYGYVMGGGSLVIGTFYWQDRSGSGWDGSWGALELIDPIYGGSCDYETAGLGDVDPHPLTKDLGSLSTEFRGGPATLRDDAVAVAWWDDGDPLIAFNEPGAGRITAVTTCPEEPRYNEVQGDFFILWRNVLHWTAQ